MELFNESNANMLHQVDVASCLAKLSQNAYLPNDEKQS